MKLKASSGGLGRWLRRGATLLATVSLCGLFGSNAQAVPSYARQTGADCTSCHVAGFGPQLTPYGIQFKLGGYTDSDGKSGKIPLSGMIVANWTKTAAALPAPPQNFSANNNVAMQEASLFLAGRLNDNIGAFIQSTYSGVDRKSALDQLDIRYARTVTLGAREAIVGLSLNTNPSLTDPFNTLGQWRFPYTSSDFGFGSGPSPLIENLGGSVAGLNAYTLWDKNLYAELGVYGSLSQRGTRVINTSRVAAAAIDPGQFKNPALYWRLAYFKDRKRDNFSVGVFGFNADVQNPDDPGIADHYRDLGVDAAYQFLGNRQHIFTLNASFVREWQKLNHTYGVLGDANNLENSLDQLKLAVSYHYDQTWGVTGSLFDTRSSEDALLNSSAYNGRSNTSGYMLQADWTPWGKETSWDAPWANARIGLQYTAYTRYQGGSHYLDENGNDRLAKDNNTLSVFVWTAF